MKKKTLIAAMGLVTSMAAQQAYSTVLTATSWRLGDFNGDGISSDMTPGNQPPGQTLYFFGADGETGCTPDPCAPIQLNSPGTQSAPNLFTTGFNFGGIGDFKPTIDNALGTGEIAATIDPALAALGDGQALQFSALDFAAVFIGPGTKLFLAPDHLTNCSGQAAGSTGVPCGQSTLADAAIPAQNNPLGYNVDIVEIVPGVSYDVSVSYGATVTGTGTSWDGAEFFFPIKGTITVTSAVPIPAAAWLFGSGLVGLVGIAKRKKARHPLRQ